MSVHYHDTLAASRRLTGFLLFVLGVGLTVGLYYVKTRAQTALGEVRALERQIAQEEALITELRAEIAFLERPERLAQLSETRLGLAPIEPERLVPASAIFDIPLREEFRAGTEAEGAGE